MKIKEAKDFSKSEAEMVDVMDTLKRATSNVEKEMAKNLTYLQKEIDTRNTNNATVALINNLSANSVKKYHRADHRRFTPETQPPSL